MEPDHLNFASSGPALSTHSSANVLLSSMLKVSDTMTDMMNTTTAVAAATPGNVKCASHMYVFNCIWMKCDISN